jgi:hypothetical protein
MMTSFFGPVTARTLPVGCAMQHRDFVRDEDEKSAEKETAICAGGPLVGCYDLDHPGWWAR